MATVIREHIMEEVKSARFVAIVEDETTDVSTQTQLVLVLRYIDGKHAVQERFFEFVPILSTTASSIADAILERLNSVFTADDKCKLIAQAYDGASVMRREGWCAAKGTQRVQKCPLFALLCTPAEFDHAAGHFAHPSS